MYLSCASFQVVSLNAPRLHPDTIICSTSFLQPPPPSSSSSLLLNLWPIYTLETQKSPLKLRRPIQQETTVRGNAWLMWSPASSPFLWQLHIRKTKVSTTGHSWNATRLQLHQASDDKLIFHYLQLQQIWEILDAACAWVHRLEVLYHRNNYFCSVPFCWNAGKHIQNIWLMTQLSK